MQAPAVAEPLLLRGSTPLVCLSGSLSTSRLTVSVVSFVPQQHLSCLCFLLSCWCFYLLLILDVLRVTNKQACSAFSMTLNKVLISLLFSWYDLEKSSGVTSEKRVWNVFYKRRQVALSLIDQVMVNYISTKIQRGNTALQRAVWWLNNYHNHRPKSHLKAMISAWGRKQQVLGKDIVCPILSASLGADLFLPLRQEPEIGYGSVAGGSPVIDFKQTGS